MGNTNLPQFGAADMANSRDTLEGAQQLTPEQIKQRDDQAKGGLNALLPDSVANESQRAVVHVNHGKNRIGGVSGEDDPSASGHDVSPDRAPTEADYIALAGHVGTGHSPSDAT